MRADSGASAKYGLPLIIVILAIGGFNDAWVKQLAGEAVQSVGLVLMALSVYLAPIHLRLGFGDRPRRAPARARTVTSPQTRLAIVGLVLMLAGGLLHVAQYLVA